MKYSLVVLMLLASLAPAQELPFIDSLPLDFEYDYLSYYNLEKLQDSAEFQITWDTFYKDDFSDEAKSLLPVCREILTTTVIFPDRPYDSKTHKLNKKQQKKLGAKKLYVFKGVASFELLRCENTETVLQGMVQENKLLASGLSDKTTRVFETSGRKKVYLLFDSSRDVLLITESRIVVNQFLDLAVGNSFSALSDEENIMANAVRHALSNSESGLAFRYINSLVLKKKELARLKKKGVSEKKIQSVLARYDKGAQYSVRVYNYYDKHRIDDLYLKTPRGLKDISDKDLDEFLSIKDSKNHFKVSESGVFIRATPPKFQLFKAHEKKQELERKAKAEAK